jgi:hypothetical protein
LGEIIGCILVVSATGDHDFELLVIQ